MHPRLSPLGARAALHVEFATPFAAPGFPATDLDVGVFDLAGRRVATLGRGVLPSNNGVVSLRWDATGRAGAGMYFVRVSAPSARFSTEKRVVVVP